MTTKNLAYLSVIATAVIWGITLPLMKATLASIPPLSLAFIRFSIAAVLALSFSNLKGLTLKDFAKIAFFAFFGITLNIGFLLIGLSSTTAINASIILALSPVITSALAFFALKERINALHLVGIFLALLGSLIYLFSPSLLSGSKIGFNLAGDFLILMAVFASGVYIIGSKKLFTSYHPSAISAISFFVGAVSFFPGAAFEYFKTPSWVLHISWFSIVSLIFLGVFSSFIAYSLLIWGLSKIDVHINATIGYLTSLIAIILSTIFLSEKLYPATFLISFSLVGVGIYLVTKYKPISHHFHHHLHRV